MQQNIARNLGTNPSVINPSRIMRISGTVSYPSQSKVAKGYIPELISLMQEVIWCRCQISNKGSVIEPDNFTTIMSIEKPIARL